MSSLSGCGSSETEGIAADTNGDSASEGRSDSASGGETTGADSRSGESTEPDSLDDENTGSQAQVTSEGREYCEVYLAAQSQLVDDFDQSVADLQRVQAIFPKDAPSDVRVYLDALVELATDSADAMRWWRAELRRSPGPSRCSRPIWRTPAPTMGFPPAKRHRWAGGESSGTVPVATTTVPLVESAAPGLRVITHLNELGGWVSSYSDGALNPTPDYRNRGRPGVSAGWNA